MASNTKIDNQLRAAEDSYSEARKSGDSAQIALAKIQLKKIRAAEDLHNRCASAMYTVTRLMEKLAQQGADMSVNSLGELQSQSAQLEAAVGALHMAQEMERSLSAILI